MRERFSSLTEPKISDLPAQSLKYRQKIAMVSAFVNVKTIIYYNARQIPRLINVGDRTYLKLYHGHELPGRFNIKISQQHCGPFKIVKWIKRIIYELELPIAWKIHPVVSVAQLEPLFPGYDPYDRPKFNHPPVIETKNDTPTYQSYEIEKLVDRRTRRYNETKMVQYLIKWFGHNPVHNQWKSFSALDNCFDLKKIWNFMPEKILPFPRNG